MTEWYFPPRKHCLLCVDPATSVDWDTGEGIVWYKAKMEAVPGPPAAGTKEREAWDMLAPKPFCAGTTPHPLPGRDSIAMVLIGPGGSGKDSLAKYLTTHCGDIMRREGGLSITVTDGESERRAQVYSTSTATKAAAPDDPHLGESWTLRPINGSDPATLVVFNTAGEDLKPAAAGKDLIERRSEFRHAFRVVPYADILVFFVPPSALIPALDPKGVGFNRTRDGFSAIVDLLRAFSISQPQVKQARTVVLAMTKCDKYANRDDFPKELLSDRAGHRWAISDLVREQAQIAEFIMGLQGGESLMDTIAPISGRVFLAAVSGTGTDTAPTPTGVVDGAHEAPPPNSAPIRAFDPLIIGLMRAGIWQGPES